MQAPPNTEEACHPKITWKADRGKQISIQNHLFIAQNTKRQRDHRQSTATAPLGGGQRGAPPIPLSCLNSVLPDVACSGWVYREGRDMSRYKGKRIQEGETRQDLSWVLDLKASARIWGTKTSSLEGLCRSWGPCRTHCRMTCTSLEVWAGQHFLLLLIAKKNKSQWPVSHSFCGERLKPCLSPLPP